MIDTTATHTENLERFTKQARHCGAGPLQVAKALQVANDVRLARAGYQVERLRGQSMEAGMIACAELLRDPPRWANTLAVWKLLGWIPRFGVKRVSGLMRAVGDAAGPVSAEISELRQIGQLTERQRLLIADELMAQAAKTAASR